MRIIKNVGRIFLVILYKILGKPVLKIKDQKKYWKIRGTTYLREMESSNKLSKKVMNKHASILIRELKRIDFRNLLEIGCGYGHKLKIIRKVFKKAEIYGIDFSPTILRDAKHYLRGMKIKLKKMDATNLKFGDNRFDVIITNGTLMHIQPNKLDKVISEIKRTTKKYAICIEPYEKHQSLKQKLFYIPARHFYLHDYENKFKQIGFKIIKCYSIPDIEPYQLSIFVLAK